MPKDGFDIEAVIEAENLCNEIFTGHLKMGGASPEGVEISANSSYITVGNEPILPVMGEFHFARYPHKYWQDELLKIKAAGINIVTSYIFWIYPFLIN